LNEGKLPIIIDGELCGAVEVSRRGGMTVFSARCRMLDGLLRLSVYGSGGEGYLGVMAPIDGELRLERSLSRTAMRGFPEQADFASRAGAGSTGAAGGASAGDTSVPQPGAEAESCGTEHAPGHRGGTELPDAAETDASASGETSPVPLVPPTPGEAVPAMPFTPALPAAGDCAEDGLRWYSSPDGVLVTNGPGRSLAALPAGDGRIPPDVPGLMRRIEGRDYLVYALENGRLTGLESADNI
jgi:hypothetical protein